METIHVIGDVIMQNFTAVFEAGERGGYICWVEEIPEAISHGETLEEAKLNLLNALKILIHVNRQKAKDNLIGREFVRDLIPISAI